MNRHQILTGACNGGDCYALGSVEGVNFVAYASGCDIVILASNFQRVVTIPGVLRGSIKVSCVDCSTDTGKIAASFGKKIHIFEPTPSNTDSSHPSPSGSKTNVGKKLDYRWFPTAELDADCYVRCLSWNVEGSRLLTGGEVIQIWEFVNSSPVPVASAKVQFHLGSVMGEEDDPVTQRLVQAIADPDYLTDHQGEPEPGAWECVWKTKPASPVTHLKYSPDSFVFASLGKNERLVKIWYEDQKVSQGLMRHDSVMSPKKNSIHYTFIYICHPRAVTGFEWRQTSKYMPRGSVANMLVTSCDDNVCRIFVETILPDAGLLDLEHFDPAMNADPKYHTQRHKKRFVQRLKNIRQAIHKRRKHPKSGADQPMNGQNLQNSTSVHDFHKFAIHHNGVSPVLHFHLACSINPDTDIPLLPIVGSKDDVDSNFRLHWLNNKDLEFTMEAEKLLQELHQRLVADEGGSLHQSSTPNQTLSDDDQSLREEDEDFEDGGNEEDSQQKRRSKTGKNDMRSGQGSRSSLSSNEDQHKDDQPPEFPLHLLQSGVIDRLDRKIDALLLDWHSSPDYVFSIHPVDGSFLVWLIDHLDESTPFTFHQAQASFSSRLPRAFPIPDARSMASNLLMYCNYSRVDVKTMMKMNEGITDVGDVHSGGGAHNKSATHSSFFGDGDNNSLIPSIHMVTKHSNGTLNQWQVSFTEKTKFQNIVSVSHVARACGHRFRTNSAACHPVLPLMLTTSHHNLPSTDGTDARTPGGSEEGPSLPETPDVEQVGPTFCSELILWQVVPVGPLSRSGGITELCRINNSCQSAFTCVAWVPTLLPSTCLGSYSNSPSALFVASDGQCLRLFQAVIDARSLLMDRTTGMETKPSSSNMSSSTCSSYPETPTPSQHLPTWTQQLFNIASLQSSTRPGCVLELDAISDALQDWQNIQLLHVYQEQLITGEEGDNVTEAVVDLSGQQTFDENFFLVVLEKPPGAGTVLHMWKLTIDSKPSAEGNVNGGYDWNQYENLVDSYNDELSPDGLNYKQAYHNNSGSHQVMTMSVRTTKVCTQLLPLPDEVEVISCSVAGGHLSSASIYPACYAPYQFVTACSDGEVRFWRCSLSAVSENSMETSVHNVTSYEFSLEDGDVKGQPQVESRREEQRLDFEYTWSEWERPCSAADRSSSVSVSGRPIAVSCAYSGRIAVAYRSGPVRAQSEHPEDKYVNLRVVILECESTGGSEWVQEDVIELNNIKIPDPKNEIDMYMLQSVENPQIPDPTEAMQLPAAQTAAAFMTRTKSVPSLSTIQSVRKSISEKGNKKGLLRQKCLVQLDWASTEDGSHLLTVGVGSKVLIYGQVSNEIARSLKNLNSQEEKKTQEDKRSAFASSKKLTMNKSMVAEEFQEEIQWMRLKGIELTTADGLPPLPMHISWVRAGILVVGMDNEMQVFTQWRTDGADVEVIEDESTMDKRTLTEANLVTAASSLNLCHNFKSKSNFKTSLSMSNFKHLTVNSGQLPSSKKDAWKRSNQTSATSKGSISLARSDSISSLPMLYDSGLFEAAKFANPVLPQYHPKLLMELLNFGKTKRVKAVLAHLVRCISGSDGVQTIFSEDHLDNGHLSVKLSRQRSVSVRSENDMDAEAAPINYVEIKSIPPLPLYALIAADRDATPFNSEIASKTATGQQNRETDYNDLLNPNILRNDDDELDDQLLLSTSADSSSSNPRRPRLPSGSAKTPSDPYCFTSAQANILREYLFKLNLPGLSGNDQFYLAALAEVVGSTALEFNDDYDESQKKEQGSTDDCGLRFLLAMRQYQCLVMTLPPLLRKPLLSEGIRTFHLVWAFHSESTQELLSAIPCVKADEPTWSELKLYGVGWWLNNMTQLKTLMLKVANTVFKTTKSPIDAALYYLAMKKKNIMKGLFKTVRDSKMEAFFALDFSVEKNQRIAKKNAYYLLGKGEFTHAAALFFLGGQVENAVSVILDKLNDLQLALVLCRLYDGESIMPESVKKLFYENVLGLDKNGENYDARNASPDPFLRSMALWQMKDYESSLRTLLEKNIGRAMKGETDKLLQIPRVFNFYNFLRTHPLITRLRLASSSLQQRAQLVSGFTHTDNVVSEGITTLDQVTPAERQLFFAAAHAHFQNGCPLVAIEVMRKLPKRPLLVEEDLQKMAYFAKRRRKSMSDINCSTGTLRDVNLMTVNGGWNSNGDMSSSPLSQNSASGLSNSSSSSHRAADLFSSPQPASNASQNKADNFNWGQSLASSNNNKDTASSIDWGAPVSRVTFKDELDELDLGLGDSDDEEEDEDGEGVNDGKRKGESNENSSPSKLDDVFGTEAEEVAEQEPNHIDIMAQQYKFIACLKVLMEELGNLATGFEVDGGQLRHQLYIWLEKETEVLKVICNYGISQESVAQQAQEIHNSSLDDQDLLDVESPRGRTSSVMSDTSAGKASLHEVFKAEKQDLQSKVARMARRKAWLKANQHLLRTLASYCIQQGSAGGGLASVRMELLLLLQELQQERPQQQLLSPLPFPTTLPLLSASITNCRSVIADPIQYLQGSIQDLLHAVVEMNSPPNAHTDIGVVSTIRDLAVALSSCIYQSLCDSDTFSVADSDSTDVGIDGFINPEFSYPSSHLMAGVKKSRHRGTGGGDEVVNTPPAKWPGVTSLKVLLAREKDEDAPKINVLLTESLISVYMSLLISAFSMYDPQMLYRLVANKLDAQTWAALFGGGNKTVVRLEKASVPRSQDDVSKHRMMFNMRVMSNSGGGPGATKPSTETKETYQEKFVPPELSMVNYFMTKPFVASSETIIDYDSDDSFVSEDLSDEDLSDEDDDDDPTFRTRPKSLARQPPNTEHTDSNSYSWSIIRFAVIKSVRENINTFLPQIGIELTELPNVSPLLHSVMRVLEQWEELLQIRLDMFSGAPDNYIPGLGLSLTAGQPRSKLQALLVPENSPFLSAQATLPIRRLWFQLLRQDSLKDLFLRYIYRKKKEPEENEAASMKTSSSDNEQQVRDPMKIIHKEQDIITSFTLNQANSNLLALSTQKEIVELDIGYLLRPPLWLEDDNEYDIELLKNYADNDKDWSFKWSGEEWRLIPNPGPELPEFLVVQTPQDTPQPMSGSQTPGSPYVPSPNASQIGLQTGRGTSVPRSHAKTVKSLSSLGVNNPIYSHFILDRSRRLIRPILRRPVLGVRRIGSHPILPHYLTGGADGAVRLWEWGHGPPITTLRQPGSFPKVTKVLFNAQGNKCCVSDTEGSICLWQVGLGSSFNKPIMSLQCHNRTTSDFQFVGSSSLIATAGQSSELKNVCLWDTLLPTRSSLVHAFQCHEQGSPAVVYASRQHLLISGGRKGEICIFDLRQRVLKHTFQAHDAPIKCLSLDPDEDYFVTGSAEGDIKVWGLKIHQLIFSFPGEHSKTTFFKNVGSTSGVAQVTMGPLNHLFSCGVDGSMKFRQLPERELVVHHWA
ncbi:dmX-like protein 2 [Aplysia californica]|uniref:DmX-like protein 2 n=2 Tax=Aplysia californica TaxID=6500 RepID=A0ABM1VRN3_APLCA|nr:dmX-like protein 2 [Aplysia californica]